MERNNDIVNDQVGESLIEPPSYMNDQFQNNCLLCLFWHKVFKIFAYISNLLHPHHV